MKIAIDTANAGSFGELAPDGFRVLIGSAVRTAREDGHELLLVGSREALEAELRAQNLGGDDKVAVFDAPSVILPGDEPQAACREKPDSSIMRAAERVMAGEAKALVTTSGSAAALAGALWHLKRLKGVLKPALASLLRSPKGEAVLLDAGANTETKPWHLLQYALMGSIYSQAVLNKADPTVALLGARQGGTGGGDLVNETLPLLKYAGLNFIGVIDGSAAVSGAADVIVADGPTGDICLRLLEGLSHSCFEMLESESRRSMVGRWSSSILRGPIRRVAHNMRSVVLGGSPILGLDGAVVLCRQPDSAEAVAGSIRTAAALAESDVFSRIRDRLEDIKADMEFARAV